MRDLDDLSSGSAETSLGVEFVRRMSPAPDRSLALNGVQGCFHLAAIASSSTECKTRLHHRINLTGTIVLLERSRVCREERIPFVYASSAAVYGDYDALPLTETSVRAHYRPTAPTSWACELHARVASVAHDIPTVGLRFFNVFGPRQNPASPYSGVISIFCDRLLRGEALTVFGDGLQSRDFVHVSTVVAALRRHGSGGMRRRPCSMSAPRSTTVLDWPGPWPKPAAESRVIHHALGRAGEVRHSLGAPEAAHSTLGLNEPLPLLDGLREVVTWMRAGRPLRRN